MNTALLVALPILQDQILLSTQIISPMIQARAADLLNKFKVNSIG